MEDNSSFICIKPINLNIDEIINQHPPKFAYKKDGFIYIIDLWYSQYTWRKKDKQLTNDEFIPLHSQSLKQVLYDYQKYLDYLKLVNVFQSNESYQSGKRSKSYRLNSFYHTETINVFITDPRIIRKINKKNTAEYLSTGTKYVYIIKWFEGLHIDEIAAFQYVNDYISSLYKPKMHVTRKRKIFLKKASYTQSINKIFSKEFQFKVDKRSGRLYTPLTNLKKDFRKYLTYNGEKLVCLDLSNSQPFLSLQLLKREFYETNTIEEITLNEQSEWIKEKVGEVKKKILTHLHNYYEGLVSLQKKNIKGYSSQSLSLPMCGKLPIENELNDFLNEFTLYESLLKTGKFYAYIGDNLHLLENRGNLVESPKKLVLTVLFSKNEETRTYFKVNKLLFKSLFPTISELFKIIKSSDHVLLAILLQSIESEIFLNRIALKISNEHPSVPLFTIHDSICTTVINESVVREIMTNEIEKAVGVKPHIKTEYW